MTERWWVQIPPGAGLFSLLYPILNSGPSWGATQLIFPFPTLLRCSSLVIILKRFLYFVCSIYEAQCPTNKKLFTRPSIKLWPHSFCNQHGSDSIGTEILLPEIRVRISALLGEQRVGVDPFFKRQAEIKVQKSVSASVILKMCRTVSCRPHFLSKLF